MIIGLKSPGPECAHRSALAHRDWLSSSHRRGARRSPPVAALPYSVFGLHRNLRCRCDLAPTRQSIGNRSTPERAGGFFLRFVSHLSKYWVLKCLQGGRVLCGPHPDPSPRPSPFVFEGRRGVAAAAPAGWPWKAPGHEPAQHEHSSAPARRLEHTSPKGPEIWFSRARQAGNGAARPRATI